MQKPRAKDAIAQLSAKFQSNLADYKQAAYKETQVRIDFIDPFFEALGWDIANRQGLREDLREVIHEDTLEIEGRKKAPDYSFRLPNGRVERKFFLEAKKPAINLAGGVTPAYQVRRYGWSANLPVSALSDFEELAVYDCRVRPRRQDKPAVARIAYFACEEYADRFDEIYGLFSKEAVREGSLDQFVAEAGLKRGLTPVDAEFLKEIEGWRDALARNIALRNPKFSIYDMNFAVQRTIDRIIFLRMAEDRKIESYGRLLDLAKGPGIYLRLVELYRQADARYNAGLFNLNPAEGDSLTPTMQLDDAPLKQILSGLYYPQSPYEFSVLGSDILGNVYEQFLGKVIRLTPAHRAKVEEKPEVKKAGGVFYTPTYIVEHIIEQTVGKLIEGKSPGQISKLRILDPACGSGSFLIGAYQYLLDYHWQWYISHNPKKRKKALVWIPRSRQTSEVLKTFEVSAPAGEWRLTIAEKKRILLNNIYGVDIDRQAVNVTQLNLLLKALEGETDQTLQLSLFQEQVLPQLSDNIKCGNSLIDSQFYASGQMTLFSDEDLMRRVNAFDWEAEFPGAMAAGGFDAVIGNPPYIRIQTMKQWAPEEVAYYKQRYTAASKGNYDIYVIFVERGLDLLNDKGQLGFILPHKFFNAKYGQALRRLLSEGKYLSEIIHFGDQQVFGKATTYTCLFFLNKQGRERFRFVKAHDLPAWRRGEAQLEGDVDADKVTADEWNFVVGPGAGLFERLSEMPVKLGDIARIFQGLVTGADKVFVLEEIELPKDHFVKVRDQDGTEWFLEKGILKPFISHVTISSFDQPVPHHWLIFPYHLDDGKAELISSTRLANSYPQAWDYLKHKGNILRNRERGKWSHKQWYAFGRTQNLTQMEDTKLIVQVISQTGKYTCDNTSIYFTGGGNGPYYGIRWAEQENSHSLQYLQGLLNSRLLDFYLHRISSPFRGGYWSYGKRFIEQLPIHTIDFSNPTEAAQHDQMVNLVEQMLALRKKVAAASNPADKKLFQRQIAAVDKMIDRLVYELYGLSEGEIKVVEEQT